MEDISHTGVIRFQNVTAKFNHGEVAQQWIAWLRNGTVLKTLKAYGLVENVMRAKSEWSMWTLLRMCGQSWLMGKLENEIGRNANSNLQSKRDNHSLAKYSAKMLFSNSLYS